MLTMFVITLPDATPDGGIVDARFRQDLSQQCTHVELVSFSAITLMKPMIF